MRTWSHMPRQKRNKCTTLPHSEAYSHGWQTPLVVVVVVVVGNVAIARSTSPRKSSVCVFMLESHTGYEVGNFGRRKTVVTVWPPRIQPTDLKRQKYSHTPNSFLNTISVIVSSVHFVAMLQRAVTHNGQIDGKTRTGILLHLAAQSTI